MDRNGQIQNKTKKTATVRTIKKRTEMSITSQNMKKKTDISGQKEMNINGQRTKNNRHGQKQTESLAKVSQDHSCLVKFSRNGNV